jgi:hypothetical protein
MTEPVPLLTVGDLKSEPQVVGRNAGDVPFAAQGTGVQFLSL